MKSVADRVNNGQDVIDSRDIIERIDELESLRDSAEEDATEHNQNIDELTELLENDNLSDHRRETLQQELEDLLPKKEKVFRDDGTREYWESDDFGDEEEKELHILLQLQDEAEGSPDWRCGESLIRDSYFEEYAEQLAEDIGAIDSNANWPVNCIDWEKAADELKADYSRVDFDGVDYWIRS